MKPVRVLLVLMLCEITLDQACARMAAPKSGQLTTCLLQVMSRHRSHSQRVYCLHVLGRHQRCHRSPRKTKLQHAGLPVRRLARHGALHQGGNCSRIATYARQQCKHNVCRSPWRYLRQTLILHIGAYRCGQVGNDNSSHSYHDICDSIAVR